MITRWIVGVAILFGILLLMLPKRDAASINKIASASMLMCTKEFREQVARQVLAKGPVSARFGNKCPDLIAAIKMGEQGDMVITGNKQQLTLTLTPVVEGARVRWSCRGQPAASVTKQCKP